jgi:hypothetical protein
MSEPNPVVAVYGTHVEAEGAVKEVQRAEIDIRALSIVGKDSPTDEHVVGYYNTGDRMKYWGKTRMLYPSMAETATTCWDVSSVVALTPANWPGSSSERVLRPSSNPGTI